MQNTPYKIPLILWLVARTTLPGLGLSPEAALKQADSLFAEKKYTQSVEIYRQLLARGYQSVPMLLRMAYVEEGLQHPAYALYYLHRAYAIFPDERVWQKMVTLATRLHATGYDRTIFEIACARYVAARHFWIAANLALTALLTALVLFYRRGAKGFAAVQVGAVTLLLVQLNFSCMRHAIVVSNNTPVMRAPSAAGGVEGSLTGGSRVHVLGQEDVWIRIRSTAGVGYVRKANLLLL